jgi:hypothetical protein
MSESSLEKLEVSLSADAGWAQFELGGVSLGDARLERRLRRVAEELSTQPQYPINQASPDVAAAKAAYRLFDNEKVTSEKVFSAHQERTVARMRAEPVVLAVQDTTFLDYSGHKKTRGLGPIGNNGTAVKLQGLVLHSTLAVTPKGLPLGLLSHRCWTREGFCHSERTRDQRAFSDKESSKWVGALEEVSSLSIATETQVVHVADRESDIYYFLCAAHEAKAHYLVRSCCDRPLVGDECGTMREQLAQRPADGVVEMEIPSLKRRAQLEVRFASITVRPPHRVPVAKKVPLRCWVVQVVEMEPPPKETPLSWTLLTNVAVTTLDEAIERLSWYRRRWAIEEFHKVLKSGCTVEDCRLQTGERLKRYVALLSIVAWRIFWMVHIARADPQAPATVVLSQSEVETLCSLERFKERLPPPDKLTVKKALAAIGALGGHLLRKNDPPPGTEAVWRGWQRLASMVELYESMTKRCG